MPYKKPPLQEQFWARVDKGHSDECWPWKGSRTQRGYGLLCTTRATHIALELAGKPRPPGAIALHSCDNPPCVNPDHLRWGDDADNVADMVKRRRHQASRKSHCVRGHPLDGDNLRLRPNGQRGCWTCHRNATAAYKAKIKGLSNAE
jgi:hypothetical protein